MGRSAWRGWKQHTLRRSALVSDLAADSRVRESKSSRNWCACLKNTARTPHAGDDDVGYLDLNRPNEA